MDAIRLLYKHRVVVIGMLLIAGMTACSKSDENSDIQGSNTISFAPKITQAKGTPIKGEVFPDGNSFGVSGYFLNSPDGTTSGTWYEDALPNFMYNVQISKAGGVFTYSPLKYWSPNKADKVKFFAWYPYNAEGVTLSKEGRPGYPYVKYTVPGKVTSQSDLMYAVTDELNGGAVNMTFKHALTQVVFSGRVATDFPAGHQAEIKAVYLSLVKDKGTLRFSDTGAEWVEGDMGVTDPDAIYYELSGAALQNTTILSGQTDFKTLTSAGYALMMIPQQLINAYLTVDYTVTNGTNTITQQKSYPLGTQEGGAGEIWNAGDAINYRITIGLNDVYFGSTHAEWDTVGNIDFDME